MADHSIKIDVKLSDENALAKLKEIRDAMEYLQKNNHVKLRVEGHFNSVTNDLSRLKRELDGIQSSTTLDLNADEINGKLDQVLETLGRVDRQTARPEIETDGIDNATESANHLRDTIASIADVAATAFDAAASVSGGLSDFAGMFGTAFDRMSGMFKSNILTAATNTLTEMATYSLRGQIDGIIERYDIMNTFADYMELAGVSEVTANNALSAVDQSIRGIPIGLDEAAFRLRKYQMYMGDIDRATQFTIGLQKALTAGGAAEEMKTTAYGEIDRLLATGKLNQSKQWLSLFNGLGVSLKFLREELALDPTASMQSIAADLASGAIATDDFIDAIARLADNEGLDQAIEIYKNTVGAWQSNINNAVRRGGQNIMGSVNDVLTDAYGYGITGVMRNIRDGIDDVAEAASGYIRNNPKATTTIGSAISGLVERAFGLDASGFIDKTVERIGDIADAVFTVFDGLPSGFLEDFTSFAVTWAGPLATLFKATQSGLPMVLGVFNRMKDFDMGRLVKDITDEIERMSGIIAGLLDILPDGLLSDLMAFGLVWGKPLASVFSGISGAIRDIAGALGSGVKFSETNGVFGALTWLATNHPLVMGALAAVGGIALAAKSAKDSFEEYAEGVISEAGLDKVRESAEGIAKEADEIVSSYQKTQETFENEMGSIRTNAEEAQKLLETILETDEKIGDLSEGSKYYEELAAQQYANIEKMKTLQPELAGMLKLDTNNRLTNAKALKEQGDAYLEYVRKMAEAEAAKEAYQETYKEYLSATQNERKNLDQQVELNDRIDRWTNKQKRLAKEQTPLVNTDIMAAAEIGEDIGKLQIKIEAAQEALGILEETYPELHDAAESATGSLTYLRDIMFSRESEARDIEWSGGIEQLEGYADDAADAVEDTKTKAEQLLKTYHELRDAATEAAKAAIGGFEKIEDVNTQPLSVTNENLEWNNTRGSLYADTLQEVLDWIADEDNQELLAGNEQAILNMIEQVESNFGDRGLLYGLADALLSDDPAEVQRYFDDQLSQLNIEETIGDLTAKVKMLLQEGLKGEEGEEEDNAFLEFAQKLVDDTLEPLKDMAEKISPDGEVGNAIAEAAQNTADSAVQALEPVTEAMDNVESAAGRAKEGIEQLASAAETKAGAFGGLISAIQNVGSAAAMATGEVNALQIAINNLPTSKTISINVAVNRSALPFASFPAKGGLIGADYLASGGFPGMAKDTDIIPAWLTPGEFVMRRAAVGLFGSRFMDRVNKMDIGGAFDALMTRISNPMSYAGATFTRDNHATVNNYFMGDGGQDYSQRKAYRYVRGL